MKSLLITAVALMSSAAFALPRAPHNALEVDLPRIKNNTYNFEGIVKLSNCSGSLVIFNGMPTSAKAVVMTNGHCIQKPGGYLNAGEVWVNRPINRGMRLFNEQMELFDIKATKIMYATMTKTDLAFYELSESYDEIMQKTGIRPLELDVFRPRARRPIEIISGYWDRGYTCAIDGFAAIVREHIWTWTDSIRYTEGCDTIGGTSGSPIIAKGTRIAIGVNNTSNTGGEKCTLHNPCEVGKNGQIRSLKGARYGQQTYKVYTCLTPSFQFDLSIPGCDLAR